MRARQFGQLDQLPVLRVVKQALKLWYRICYEVPVLHRKLVHCMENGVNMFATLLHSGHGLGLTLKSAIVLLTCCSAVTCTFPSSALGGLASDVIIPSLEDGQTVT